MLGSILAYVRGFWRRRAIEREADEELEFHIAHETDRLVAEGLTPAEARRRALASLGGITQGREAIRDVRTLGFTAIGTDVRYGWRSLTSNPRVSVLAVATGALAIGGMTLVLTLVHRVLIVPLAAPNADRLVSISDTRSGSSTSWIQLRDITAMRESRTIDAWGLYRPRYVFVLERTDGDPLMVQDLKVSPELSDLAGLELVRGRALQASDAQRGASPVVVISHALWREAFGLTEDILSKHITVGGHPRAIVGVLAPSAELPSEPGVLRLLTAMRLTDVDADAALQFVTFARLARGATVETAAAELSALISTASAAQPAAPPFVVSPLLDVVVGSQKLALLVVFGAVAAVLLIAVANIICLQLARNTTRGAEIELRRALGASNPRLLRQLLIEALLLCGIAAAIGLVAARVAIPALVATLPSAFPRLDAIRFGEEEWLFGGGLTVICAIVIGLVPAWQALRVTRGSCGQIMAGRQNVFTSHRTWLQRFLIGAQTAVAITLLIGAGLLLHTYYRLATRDAGMREDGLIVVTGNIPIRIRPAAAQRQFWSEAHARLQQLDGIAAVAHEVNTPGPLSARDNGMIGLKAVEDTRPAEAGLRASIRRVRPGYFEILGIPVVEGRDFGPGDSLSSARAAVVNRRFAEALWPGQSAIGRRFGSGDPWTVVGVVPTFHLGTVIGEPTAQFYTSVEQENDSASSASFIVRLRPGNTPAADQLMAAVTGGTPGARATVTSMADRRWNLLANERFRTALLTTFALTAVALALVGILGLVSYSVAQRQREIAIRVAVGATSSDVLRHAITHAMMPALAGLVAGVIGATFATQLLTAFLVDVGRLDPGTYAAAFATFASLALIAAYFPARRVLTIDPVETLRQE